MASTFNEELLTHHLLARTNDPKMRAYIINRQIDDIRGTLFRQTMFAEFEKLFTRSRNVATPSPSTSSNPNTGSCSRSTSCPTVVLDPELDLECLRIPHFYSAFYVYNMPLASRPRSPWPSGALGAPGAVEAYLEFLKSGGAKFPLETLQRAGVDMTTAAPVQSTLRLFERRLAEMENLL